jgi:hypothetical protein
MHMGDHRAGSSGTTATADASTAPAHPGGRRVARHAAERRTSQPYAGRRIAQVVPAPVAAPSPILTGPTGESLPYPGRRVAGRRPVARRVAFDSELMGELTDDLDVSGHLLESPTATSLAPTLAPYVGRRASLPTIIVDPVVGLAVDPVVPPPVELVKESLTTAPAVTPPLVIEAPVLDLPTVLVPASEVEPAVAEPAGTRAAKQGRTTGRRVASRRTRIPSLPLLAGVAVLAISTCGALQAVNPGLGGAGVDGHLSPASALSGSSAVGSSSLLGGRGTVVSRSSGRTDGLQAAADAQAKERDAALSTFANQAQKRAAQIKLHQWVLPVAAGVYHLTARFGDYSSLWAHFHTGLDFAAPTGTPIVAIAGGTITDVGYSGAYGNRTIETLPDGTELWYCHQNEFGTSVGATVKPGQVIGYVGSTGNVTGPHLHLEVHPGGGDPVDPYTALVVHGLQP